MREIKFRAWDLKTKQWREDINISLSGVLFDEYSNAVENVEIVQFTGLKDKNGNEIYEGDIVRDLFFPDAVDKVEWREDYAFFNPFFREDTLHFCGLETVEVIGNIYENPELLKNTGRSEL